MATPPVIRTTIGVWFNTSTKIRSHDNYCILPRSLRFQLFNESIYCTIGLFEFIRKVFIPIMIIKSTLMHKEYFSINLSHVPRFHELSSCPKLTARTTMILVTIHIKVTIIYCLINLQIQFIFKQRSRE